MSALNRRIEALEQERQAMAMALSQSRGAHTEAMARIALGAEQEMEPVQPRWRREHGQADHSGRCMALAAMTSAPRGEQQGGR